MNQKKKLLLAVSIFGAVISAYLTILHYKPDLLICPNQGLLSCETVLGSSYAVVFGVPTALASLIRFVVVLLFVFYNFDKIVGNLWMLIGFGGLVYSVAAMDIIGKICVYCGTLDILIIATFLIFKSGIDEHKRSNT